MDETIHIPRRSEVIRQWQAGGGQFVAVFPIHYPRELFRAHGLLPVEVWGPPTADPEGAGEHLQASICPIVRRGLAFFLCGALDEAAGVVVPHACDSLQGLGSLLSDFFEDRGPRVMPLYLPRGTGPAQLEYLAAELRACSEHLADLSGCAPGRTELLEAIDREERADRALAELHSRSRRQGLSALAFYRLARSREYLPAEQFISSCGSSFGERHGGAPAGARLLLSGIVPEPMGALFETLHEAGATVVADDLACSGRRLYPAGHSEDPFLRMAERIAGAPPDPSRGSPIQKRIDHLAALAASSGARGALFLNVTFCEPELFDLPTIRLALGKRGIPSLVVETDLGAELPSQVKTRLQAFVEMLR